MIRPIYLRCAKLLVQQLPEAAADWVTSIEVSNPLISAIQKEVLTRLEQPQSKLRHHPWTEESFVAADTSPPFDRLRPTLKPGMDPHTVGNALTTMAFEGSSIDFASRDVYRRALRFSLGFESSPPSNGDTVFKTQMRVRRDPPNSREVADLSGLSLPHLEFNNIVLSKATAVRFLNLSRSGVPEDSLEREVLTSAAYFEHFKRNAITIRQRPLFTYAEVLSMVGYVDNVTIPSWLETP